MKVKSVRRSDLVVAEYDKLLKTSVVLGLSRKGQTFLILRTTHVEYMYFIFYFACVELLLCILNTKHCT